LPLAYFANGLLQTEAPPQVAALPVNEEALAEGDLIFRRGRDLMAGSVLAADPSARFSHVGIILRQLDGLVVVHAVPDEGGNAGGVIVEPLAHFLASEVAVDHAILRLRGLTSRQQLLIRNAAFEQLGKPFDFELRLSDASQVYCSELVLRVFASAGVGLGDNLREVRTVMMSEPAVAPDSLRGSARLWDVTDLVAP